MMNKKSDFLPESVNWHTFNARDALAINLSQKIYQILSQSIIQNGQASFAVSGGRSPLIFFEEISKIDLDWSKVDLTLVDERWVNPTHSDSNELLVRKHLIKNKASNINFVPLMGSAKRAIEGQPECEKSLQKIKQPFDIVILGMGNDGHTASLFPYCDELSQAMDPKNSQKCIATTPRNAPHERISLTYSTIINAKHRILHLSGSEKLNTLERAITSKDAVEMPIYAFLDKPIELYWSP